MGIQFGVDIEVTNRCNAKCHFCPRDLTPHQGLMSTEVFDQALLRAVEYRDLVAPLGHTVSVSLCGLGEPLLNKRTPTFVSQVRATGMRCDLSSNGALLDERRGDALLEAGLNRIFLNVGDTQEAYEEVYQLPFAKTRDNVVRFLETARGRCEVYIVLVNHRRSTEHLEAMRRYWREFGAEHFVEFEIINRGGTLFVDDMQFESYPQMQQARQLLAHAGIEPFCPVPFGYLFVGYDGNYYLCCSDWQKEAPLASVFDESLAAIHDRKLMHVQTREPVCKRCNHDPINRLAHELRAIDDGEVEASAAETMIEGIRNADRLYRSVNEELAALNPHPSGARARKLIPVIGT
jgi:MoaA/NifB/PqqE/SkfB family radical SAM enzyme